MLKGFKEFLSRGNIVDLSVAVVIGTAFTALVTKFTESIITPLINRIGVNQNSDVGILRIGIGGGNTIDLNIVLSAAINFILVAAVVYFLVVLPYNTTAQAGRGRAGRRRPDRLAYRDPRPARANQRRLIRTAWRARQHAPAQLRTSRGRRVAVTRPPVRSRGWITARLSGRRADSASPSRRAPRNGNRRD